MEVRKIKRDVDYPYIDPTYLRLQNVDSEKNGVLLQVCKSVLYDPREEYKGISFRDFSLENLIKLDSPLLTREYQMQNDNIDNVSKIFGDVHQSAVQTQKEN